MSVKVRKLSLLRILMLRLTTNRVNTCVKATKLSLLLINVTP